MLIIMDANKEQDIESYPQTLDVTAITTRSESTLSDSCLGNDPLDSNRQHLTSNTFRVKVYDAMTRNLLPDEFVQIKKMNHVVSVEMFRLVKYLALIYALILSAIPFIRWVVSNVYMYQIKTYLRQYISICFDILGLGE